MVVVALTDHQAFGEEIGVGVGLRKIEQGYSADKATRQGYGLTENDESSGQQHTWFRKLETQAGRWTSPDPYKGSMNIGDPQSFNRYAYVSGDPVNFIDPSGLYGEPPCSGGRPVYNANGITIGWFCPVTRAWGPGGGGGGGRPPIVDSGGGRGGGGVADRTFDSDENGDDQEKIEECARKAMRNARRNVPSLAARQHTGVLATLAGGYILLRSGPGALLLPGPRRSSFRITRIKPEGNKAIAASAVGTLGSALSGSMLWDALKDSLGVMSAIDQCRKEHPNGQLSHATLARLALSIF